MSVISGQFPDLVAHGLRAVLRADRSVRLLAWNVAPAELEVALSAHRPQVAILDFERLPGPPEVGRLREAHPDSRIILLSTELRASGCVQMLSFGASACLAMTTEARDVLNAVHLASRGLRLLPSGGGAGRLSSEAAQLLTAREEQVLGLLRQALSNSQIASLLGISIETVRTHARSVYRKLGVSSRRELIGRFDGGRADWV